MTGPIRRAWRIARGRRADRTTLRTPGSSRWAVENLHHRQVSADPGRRQHADLLDRARPRGARPRGSRRHQRQGGAPAVSHAHAARGLDALRGFATTSTVTVHWTDPVDRSQSYIPMASPFVSKLATLAADAHSARPFDVDLFALPGALRRRRASRLADDRGSACRAHGGQRCRPPLAPSAIRSALRSRAAFRGSRRRDGQRGGARDPTRGRCAPRGRAAAVTLCRKTCSRRKGRGSTSRRSRANSKRRMPTCATHAGAALHRDTPHFGIYGKLGDNKGSFAHSRSACTGSSSRAWTWDSSRWRMAGRRSNGAFAIAAQELGLTDRVLQIPFLPHWRVPGIPARMPRGLLPGAEFSHRLSQPDHAARSPAVRALPRRLDRGHSQASAMAAAAARLRLRGHRGCQRHRGIERQARRHRARSGRGRSRRRARAQVRARSAAGQRIPAAARTHPRDGVEPQAVRSHRARLCSARRG